MESADGGKPAQDLTLPEAAELLGVHYMTAYKYVRTGRLRGRRIGTRWYVRRADLERLSPPGPAGRRSQDPRRRQRWRPQIVRLSELLIKGDEAQAWRLLERALATRDRPEELYLDLLAPALRAIGDGWSKGYFGVADEHRATVLTYRLVGRLGPLFARPGPSRGSIVVGAPAGDPHGLASALVADPLRGRGWSVVDLGADTPVASWTKSVLETERLVAVGVVASSPGHDDVVAKTIAAVRQARATPVILGGTAIEDEGHARRLGADIWTLSARDALEHLDIART
jgi:excisionase family DNA binding protein